MFAFNGIRDEPKKDLGFFCQGLWKYFIETYWGLLYNSYLCKWGGIFFIDKFIESECPEENLDV